MKKRMQRVGMLVALSLALSACSPEAPAATDNNNEETKPVPVQIETVKLGTLNDASGITGKLSPSEEVALTPKISGKIVSINVELGQYVKKGQVLFSLDKTDLMQGVQQAEAAYKLALANLNQSKTSASQSLEAAKTGLRQAEQALADAQINEQRMSELYKAGAISSQQMEQAKTALINAQNAYENAKQSLEAAEKQAPIEVSEASVAQAKVALDNAREQLANATVVAPISGYISSVNGAVGEMAAPQQPVVTIVNTDPLLVKANLSEQEVTGVKVGDKVKVEIAALQKEVEGTVTAVSPVMDPGVKAYPVEISLANSSNELKADMVVSVKLVSQQADRMLIIPRKAAFDENGKRYVYKLEGEAAKKVEVVTGQESSDLIEVKQGLAEGDQVVVRGQTMLKDGIKVEVQQNSN
ncbi:MAG: efflux RND transporter periplasmic adaptor subunit [Brevibacillus sp.]|nr:efflux RND transporter periplasmic adaptor subunit [Brevibacillus sp.]